MPRLLLRHQYCVNNAGKCSSYVDNIGLLRQEFRTGCVRDAFRWGCGSRAGRFVEAPGRPDSLVLFPREYERKQPQAKKKGRKQEANTGPNEKMREKNITHNARLC